MVPIDAEVMASNTPPPPSAIPWTSSVSSTSLA